VALDFKSLLAKKSQPLLGLDISSGSVKLVELSAVGKNFRLERYAIEPLPKGVMLDGSIDNMDIAAEVMSRAVKKLGAKNRNVAMAMPSAQVITKRIFLPADLSEEEYETLVESEASQYIPFALDEVTLDFQVLGPTQDAPGDVEVMIAASRWDKVEDRVALAESAGLKALVMDVDSYAARLVIERLAQQMPDQALDKVIAVFNIGANTTNLSVFLNGQNVYVRDQPFGGAQLTQDIARTYDMTFEEADARKRSGDLPENYRSDLLQPFIDTAIADFVRALQFFFTSTPYSRADMILLAGGSAVLPGLAEAVANATQVAAVVMNPFKGMDFGSAIRERQLQMDAPGLLISTGLAMRRFEL
jgi:type IV pilus assembly protein PilM